MDRSSTSGETKVLTYFQMGGMVQGKKKPTHLVPKITID